MNFLDIANRHSREQVEADPHVALLIVHPDEDFDIRAMLDARPDCQIVHREPGLDDDTLLYVHCADDGDREGLERAWMSFRRFRRGLVQTWRERLRSSAKAGSHTPKKPMGALQCAPHTNRWHPLRPKLRTPPRLLKITGDQHE